MRLPPFRVVRSPWLVLTALCVAAAWRAVALSGLSGAAMPLLLTVVVVAAIGVAMAVATVRDGEVGVVAGALSRYGSVSERGLARQCDPDAAGRVRPRAPGCVGDIGWG
jgi:C4-dicarboxylate transporter